MTTTFRITQKGINQILTNKGINWDLCIESRDHKLNIYFNNRELVAVRDNHEDKLTTYSKDNKGLISSETLHDISAKVEFV